MKNTIKTIAAITAFGIATAGICIGNTFANEAAQTTPTATMPAMTLQAPPKHKHKHKHHFNHYRNVKIVLGHPSPWRLGLARNKHLSVQDARTIATAALLMHNRHDLKVSDVVAKVNKRGHKYYLIDITNAQNNIVNKVKLNAASGHIRPVRNMS